MKRKIIRNKKASKYQFGQVYLMEFVGEGHEQTGVRPGVVFQNNVGNRYSPNIVAIPLTTNLEKVGQPTHVFIPCDGTGLLKDSVALCENPKVIQKERIGNYLTTLPEDVMEEIAIANMLASSAIIYIGKDKLSSIYEQAAKLNATTSVA